VSQFYASLYTHSVAWALDGKAEAKRARRRSRSESLDRALRRTMEDQTKGVPIGPDTSFLVAELVMTAVDRHLERSVLPRGRRYLDDYELAFPTRTAAEEGLAQLEEAMAEYELVINPSKTELLELPQPFAERWLHEISTFPVRSGNRSVLCSDLRALFGRAAEIARDGNGAIKYALRRLRSIEIEHEMVWRVAQNLAWSAAAADPTTLAVVLDLLAEKAEQGNRKIDRDAASETVEGLIETHCAPRNTSVVAWALWTAISLGLELSQSAAKKVAGLDDDIVALLALLADEAGQFGSGGVDRTLWEAATGCEGVLSGTHWLLAYEGAVRGWLEAPVPHVRNDRFFRTLASRGVHFFDGDPEHVPFTGAAAPLPGMPVPEDYQ
jgi:hypothetical protein